jgi:TonB family protein
MPRKRSHAPSRGAIAAALLLALLIHLPLAWWYLDRTFWNDTIPPEPDPMRVTLLSVSPPIEEPEPEAEPEVEPEPQGQVVDIAPPENDERPDEANHLAEYDATVDEETIDPRYRLDRTVTAETYSPDDAWESEDAEDLNQQLPSTGATAGREMFKTGRYSLFPNRESLFDRTNKEGFDLPVPASHSKSRRAGAPSNDYLPDIASADKTALNAHEFLFAAYINRVSQYVSFFADQTLSNARPSIAVRRPKYQVVLNVMIGADGVLRAADVIQSCGVPEFDAAVQEAFALASPFPEPPEAGLNEDGQFGIPSFGMTIMMGAARAEMSGIDPRSNVQFPGLQTYPR